MGRTQVRLAVWALAILTSVAIFGDHTALASNNQPRVEGGGWFRTNNPDAPNGTAKVNFGVTGKFDKDGNPKGQFEYHNQFSGLKAHGKITTLTFGTASDACVFFSLGETAGKPTATLGGQCDDGNSCSFSIEVVDGGDPGKLMDWVCNVNVVGPAKNHTMSTDQEPAAPLGGGNIKIRSTD